MPCDRSAVKSRKNLLSSRKGHNKGAVVQPMDVDHHGIDNRNQWEEEHPEHLDHDLIRSYPMFLHERWRGGSYAGGW